MQSTSLPEVFRDTPLFSSRKGPLGKIVVNKYTGVMPNAASKTVTQFEKNMGGDKEEIALLLESNPSLTGAESKLVELLRDPGNAKKSLAFLIAESKAEPARVIGKASEGALLLGRAEAYIEIGRTMPHVVRELRRHITPTEKMCQACAGQGKVPRSPLDSKAEMTCPVCKGEAVFLETSDHMTFSVDKLVEMSKMGRQPGAPMQIAVQQNTVSPGALPSGTLEKILSLSSNLVFDRPPDKAQTLLAETVDAEEVDSFTPKK